MPTRIEIELTSASPDGSWTWRAAGARQPRGVLDGSILPSGASVGDQFKVEAEQNLDGIQVLSVVAGKEKAERDDLLELLPTSDKFEPVIQQRAPHDERDGGRRGPRRDGERSDRRDRRPDDRGPRREGDGPRRERRDGDSRGERPGGDRPGGERRGPRGPHRPHFTPPPEVPQRPKPKRLRPGKQHRTDVLTSLPEEQRPVAELALQGLAAVRQRLREDNARLKAEGKPEMPEAAVLKMAEELLPRLRVADWLDRADAAKRQLEHLDLRDLRSVVAASEDALVVRDESTRQLAAELKAALVTRQEEELTLWLGDVEAALEVGRIVRALRLSSQPPKAGVPFPPALAARLGEAAAASLQPTDPPDRWIAVLEAAAFSPVRTHVVPTAPAEQRSDDLLKTVKRLGPLLPQVAALFAIDVPDGAPVPKPLRQVPRKQAAKDAAKPKPARPRGGERRRDEAPAAEAARDEPAATPAVEEPAAEPVRDEAVAEPAAEAPVAEPAPEPPAEAAPTAAEEPVGQPAAEPPAETEPMAAEEPAAEAAPDEAAESGVDGSDPTD